MTLLEAIKNAHAGKYKTLDVQQIEDRFCWDPGADPGWIAYKEAMGILSRHPMLMWILRKTHVI